MTAPAGDTTTAPATETTGTDTTDQPADGVKLTPEQQAIVNAAIAQRLKDYDKKVSGEVERRVNAEIEKAQMSAAERAQAERDEAKRERDETKTSSSRAVAEARVETALLAAGIKQARIDAVARLINLDDVAGAEDAKSAAADAVRQVLADFPEFKPTPGASGGELGGGGQEGAVTAKQFAEMDYDARAALYAKDPALYRRLRDAA